MWHVVYRLSIITTLCVGSVAFANSGKLNLNADLGVGMPFTGRYGTIIDPAGPGSSQAYGLHLVGGADYQFVRPFALELVGGGGFQIIPQIINLVDGNGKRHTVIPHLYLGVGPRLRFLDDTPGNNLWTSLHLGCHLFDGLQFGTDAALGYQIGVWDGLSIGPFARGSLLFDFGPRNRHGFLLTAGVSAAFDLIPLDQAAPLDIDGDGVPDDADRCPQQAGPGSNQGCPEPKAVDSGQDSVVETAMDSIVDTDKDGIVDSDDACPNEAGVAGERGCPVKDSDKDSVPDRTDNCPAEAGPAENQGCPAAKKQLVVVTREAINILDKVYFDTDKAKIQKRSFGLLDQVAGILTEKTWIKKLRIEGHTDDRGKAAKNQALSTARANAVRDYLIKKGIDGARLEAVGFGQDKPVESNKTAKGRAANRRVEFKVVEGD